ncbi:MAG: hypothetical protein OXC31_01910 [Spirochaetaceae bacterium]|nr:hypothetical protein [Spirochaetaceae bacterium]
MITAKDQSVPILMNHVTRNNLKVLGTGTVTVDITGYFRGGRGPAEYELTPPAVADDTVFASDSLFKAELDKETGMLTIKAGSATETLEAVAYTTGETVTFKATDADKISTANVELTVKANREPTYEAGAVIVTVGAQAATDGGRDGLDSMGKKTTIQPNPVCAMFATCVYTFALNTTPDPDTATFQANLEAAAGDGNPVTFVTDDDIKGLMFSIVSHDENVQASASDNTITITGVKTTFDDDEADDHAEAAVTVKATDANGLSVERDLMVRVDTPPEIKSQFNSSYELPQGTDAVPVINDPRGHFKDAETPAITALTIKVATSDAQKVGLPTTYTDGVIPSGTETLSLIPRNQGSATITVTAEDARGQTAVQTFTVTVKAAGS